MDQDYLQQQLMWRYAAKHFDADQKIPREQVEQVIEAMRLAPSSFGIQPWKFVVVSSEEAKQALAERSFDQPQVTECSHVIVVAHRTEVLRDDIARFMDRMAEVREVPRDSLDDFESFITSTVVSRGSEQTRAWAARQSYIALGFGIMTAALLEIDSCPMEGLEADKVGSFLGLDADGYVPVAYLALGYRSPKDETKDLAKVRYPTAEVIEWR